MHTAQEMIGVVGMLGDEVRRDLNKAMSADSLGSAVAYLGSARVRLDLMLDEVSKASARLKEADAPPP